MSGGHFQYKQWEIGNIADEVEQLIIDNDSEELNQYGDRKGYGYSKETMAKFKEALTILRHAHIYTQRIDWLVSGDDGEDSFHRRLKDELKNEYQRNSIR